ncbi:DUF551 domain-containing protein [Lonsdalea quercina]|uniref:DUF551 domain-containing protein n=1 Tax=Lonsdalea quercina TaxID=71657 RepID=UPI003976B3FA
MGWIKCSDRLPEKGGNYQVWNGKYMGLVCFFFGSFQCLNPEQITHWAPPPDPPKD